MRRRQTVRGKRGMELIVAEVVLEEAKKILAEHEAASKAYQRAQRTLLNADARWRVVQAKKMRLPIALIAQLTEGEKRP